MTNSTYELFVNQIFQSTTDDQRKQARAGKKVFVENHRGPGWSGELPFYLFECPECGELSVDYPHSYPKQQYLACKHCNARIDFVSWRTKIEMALSIARLVRSRRREVR